MRKLVLIFILGVAFWACSDSATQADKAATTGSQMAAADTKKIDGEKVYKKRCVVCHGINGDMGMSGAKDLTNSELPVEERVNIITNGKNVMTAFGEILDEDEIQAVAEYTLTLKE